MHHIFFLIPILLIFSIIRSIFYQKNKKNYVNKDDDIRKLTRQCSRWLIAAQQDESPLIATLHLQYGMGYLWAIKDITTTKEFNNATGLNFVNFENHAIKIQDYISKKMIKACPQFAGDIDKYLGTIAGEI